MCFLANRHVSGIKIWKLRVMAASSDVFRELIPIIIFNQILDNQSARRILDTVITVWTYMIEQPL